MRLSNAIPRALALALLIAAETTPALASDAARARLTVRVEVVDPCVPDGSCAPAALSRRPDDQGQTARPLRVEERVLDGRRFRIVIY